MVGGQGLAYLFHMNTKANSPAIIQRLRHHFWSLRLAAIQLVLLVFLAPAVSLASVRDCEASLRAVQEALGDNPKTEAYDESARFRTTPSVDTIGSAPGRHGGRILTLHKTGTRWLSDHRTVGYDPQGDPRWFIEVMGYEAAEFFGFKLLSDTRVQVPDGREFNGAIREINKHLTDMHEEPIGVSFYETKSEGNTKVEHYVRQFGESGGLPMAPGGNHLIHDLSFHAGAIFLSGPLLQLGKYFARFLDGYLNYLAKKYAGDPERTSALRHIALLLRMNHTVTIDTGTGTLSPGIVAVLRKPEDLDSWMYIYAPVEMLSGAGEIASTYFAKKISALDPSGQYYGKEFAGLLSTGNEQPVQSERTSMALARLNIDQLRKDLLEFSSLKSVPGFAEWNDRNIPRDEKSIESICKGIGERRLVIRRAALKALGKN
jgi:hypothetical protein